MSLPEDTGRGAVAPSRAALQAVLVVTAVSLVGAVISVRSDLSPTYLDALGPEGFLSVPLPMTAFQLLAALAAGSQRRTLALVGSGVLSLAVTVAVVSGFFDGGYADDRLGTGQRVYQLVLVVGLCAVAVAGVKRFVDVWRSRAARQVA